MWFCDACKRKFYGYNIWTFYSCHYCQSSETREIKDEKGVA